MVATFKALNGRIKVITVLGQETYGEATIYGLGFNSNNIEIDDYSDFVPDEDLRGEIFDWEVINEFDLDWQLIDDGSYDDIDDEG